MASCLALCARLTKLPGVRLPTRDSIQAIELEIVRLRRADAPVANVKACEHWRDRTVDFLFVDNRLRQARQAGRMTTSLRIGWVRALIFCLWAQAAASLHRA
jgi:hypothetical protein